MLEAIASCCGAKSVGMHVEAGWGTLYLSSNVHATDALPSHDKDFIEYTYCVDIEPADTCQESYIEKISHTLDCLRLQVGPAVAACSFEDRLPYRGGVDLMK